jgi:hypothetical protein
MRCSRNRERKGRQAGNFHVWMGGQVFQLHRTAEFMEIVWGSKGIDGERWFLGGFNVKLRKLGNKQFVIMKFYSRAVQSVTQFRKMNWVTLHEKRSCYQLAIIIT